MFSAQGFSFKTFRGMTTVIVTLLIVLMFWTVRSELGNGFSEVLYATFRLEWLFRAYALLYVIPVAVALGTALGSFAGSTQHWRLSVGLLLLVCAGFAPATVDRLLVFVLAMVCFSVGAAPPMEQTKATA
ncbi:MAG: hypothetical protein IPJ88_07845 [Myxococcales bacterium]|nr:MAG: hypothetical protein IPJ88_07845 [Myxococcales bacterium]